MCRISIRQRAESFQLSPEKPVVFVPATIECVASCTNPHVARFTFHVSCFNHCSNQNKHSGALFIHASLQDIEHRATTMPAVRATCCVSVVDVSECLFNSVCKSSIGG